LRSRPEIRVCEDATPPAALGGVHGGVRAGEQAVARARIVGEARDPDAGRERERPPVDDEGVAERGLQAAGQFGGRFDALDLGQQDRELVAADAAGRLP